MPVMRTAAISWLPAEQVTDMLQGRSTQFEGAMRPCKSGPLRLRPPVALSEWRSLGFVGVQTVIACPACSCVRLCTSDHLLSGTMLHKATLLLFPTGHLQVCHAGNLSAVKARATLITASCLEGKICMAG